MSSPRNQPRNRNWTVGLATTAVAAVLVCTATPAFASAPQPANGVVVHAETSDQHKVVNTTPLRPDAGGAKVVAVPAATTPWFLANSVVGGTIEVRVGSWAPKGASVTYQWTRDGKTIPKQSGPKYVQVKADVGHRVNVRVISKYKGATKTWTSANGVTLGHFVGALNVTLSGTPQVGRTLTAKTTAKLTPTPTSYTYQWYRNGVKITSAVKSTYTLTAADYGTATKVIVSAKRTNYIGYALATTKTKIAAGAAVTGKPTWAGTRKEGSTLTITPGTFTPAATKVSYQWYRNGKAITGATKAAYTETAADVGTVTTAKVTAARTGHVTATWTLSSTTKTVALSVFAAPKITVAGEYRVGQQLTATVAPIAGTPAVTYQWTRNGRVIVGATASKYTPTAGDIGSVIRVMVTATKAGYATNSWISAAAPETEAGIFTGGQVVALNGDRIVGEELYVTLPETVQPTPERYYVSWFRDGEPILEDDDETLYAEVSYTQTEGDIGHVISVTITAVLDGYETQTWASEEGDATAEAEGTGEEGGEEGGGEEGGEGLTFVGEADPVVTGTRYLGSELTYSPGYDWDVEGATLDFQWYRGDHEPIIGATDSTYVLSIEDLGFAVNVEVTASKEGYETHTWGSHSTDLTVYDDGGFTTSYLFGTEQAPNTLHVWEDPEENPEGYTYQWFRGGEEVTDQLSPSYELTNADIGKFITCIVTVPTEGESTHQMYFTTTGAIAAPEGYIPPEDPEENPEETPAETPETP